MTVNALASSLQGVYILTPPGTQDLSKERRRTADFPGGCETPQGAQGLRRQKNGGCPAGRGQPPDGSSAAEFSGLL